MFSLILVITTLVTGLLWCLDKFAFFTRFHERNIGLLRNISNEAAVNKTIEEISLWRDWLKNGASVFPMLAFVTIIRSFFYEPFQIPSASMMPTLLIGDFILVEKFSYGIKDPVFQKTLVATGHPKRGDVVVFRYPRDLHLNYIKRIIGLPGDKVVYNLETKEIFIQDKFSFDSISKEEKSLVTYSDIKPSNFCQFFLQNNKGEIKSYFFKLSKSEDNFKKTVIRLIERKESIGNTTHYILTVPVAHDRLPMYYQQPEQKLAVWDVPKEEYFVMGDNRDNSADSRYWGFVPEKNLVGKAKVIWMSFKKQEGEWPTGVQLKRIGLIH